MTSGKRILMILGGILHDFDGFAAVMKPVLEACGHGVEATYDLDSLTRLDEGRYDLVLSYTSLSRHRDDTSDTAPETLTEAQTESLARWVGGGRGLLAVHCATVSGRPNPALRALIGGIFVTHPPQFSFPVFPMSREHPITAGVEAFVVRDEFYMQECDQSVRIHMVAVDRSVAHPMVWTRSEGTGRVAHIAMGHGPEVWNLRPYRQLVKQAVEWLTARPADEA